jgi:hypothetical protein
MKRQIEIINFKTFHHLNYGINVVLPIIKVYNEAIEPA